MRVLVTGAAGYLEAASAAVRRRLPLSLSAADCIRFALVFVFAAEVSALILISGAPESRSWLERAIESCSASCGRFNPAIGVREMQYARRIDTEARCWCRNGESSTLLVSPSGVHPDAVDLISSGMTVFLVLVGSAVLVLAWRSHQILPGPNDLALPVQPARKVDAVDLQADAVAPPLCGDDGVIDSGEITPDREGRAHPRFSKLEIDP